MRSGVASSYTADLVGGEQRSYVLPTRQETILPTPQSHVVHADASSPAHDLLRSINIPPRPALLMALQRETRKDEPDLRKITELLGRDVAMAGSLLQTANSAFFNLSRPVKTVGDALALMGMSQCDAMMTGLIARRVLTAGQKMMARFWDVSEKRSRAMNYLSKQMRVAPPELAHSFGLFCDIGIPLLKVGIPNYLATLAEANMPNATRFTDIENARHGLNHADVGALLAENWGIAPDVVHAIRMHHAPEVLYDDAVPVTVRAMVATNLVVEKAIQEYRGEPVSLEWQESGLIAADALGLSTTDIEYVCEELKARFALGSSA